MSPSPFTSWDRIATRRWASACLNDRVREAAKWLQTAFDGGHRFAKLHLAHLTFDARERGAGTSQRVPLVACATGTWHLLPVLANAGRVFFNNKSCRLRGDSCPGPRKPLMCQYIVLLLFTDTCSSALSCSAAMRRGLPRAVNGGHLGAVNIQHITNIHISVSALNSAPCRRKRRVS